VANREKKIDTDIVTSMVADSYEILDPRNDQMTLVAGDADYVPAVEKLRKREIHVEVVFWEQASCELKESCSRFVPLDPYLYFLTR